MAEADDYRPPFRRIADDLRGQIRSGRLQPGDRLPTYAELCERYSVAHMTARSALHVLKSEGLVYGVQGVGSFVRDPTPESTPSAPDISQQLDTVLSELRQLASRVAHIEDLLSR
jgi:DNA-binding GntR family transcriptional regulator